MINAAFRLPELSVRYLHTRILEAQSSGTPITPSEIQQEILWREQSHSIDQHSIYASANAAATIGMPLEGSEAVPPLVTTLQPGTVASFPLRFNHAEAYIGEGLGARTALVGDAAHTVHPLAGQGLNMGLGDVESLVRCIENAFLLGGDIGEATFPLNLYYSLIHHLPRFTHRSTSLRTRQIPGKPHIDGDYRQASQDIFNRSATNCLGSFCWS